MSVNYNIFSYIFPSFQIVEGWYIFCIFPNRNKRWSLLSHYGDVDFLLGVILAVGPFLTSNKCMGVLCKPSCKEIIEFVY